METGPPESRSQHLRQREEQEEQERCYQCSNEAPWRREKQETTSALVRTSKING